MTSIESPHSFDAPPPSVCPVDPTEDVPQLLSQWKEALQDPREHEALWEPLSQIAKSLHLRLHRVSR